MSSKSTLYQGRWVKDFPWVKEGKPGNAFCLLCKKEFSISSMGRQALVSHEKGKKHIEHLSNASKSVSIKTFLSTPSTSNTTSVDKITSSSTSSSFTDTRAPECQTIPASSTLTSRPNPKNTIAISIKEKFQIKESVTNAEILWCLNTVMNKMSLRSAESSGKLLKRMFPESDVANAMRLGKDKIGYTLLYGIAPYFESSLKKSVLKCKTFVVGFDESLNNVSQSQQMDISIRFWDESSNMVKVRYFNSVFLHSSTAVDLLQGLKDGLKQLDLKKILQFSMDGPNVNLKLLKLFKKEVRPNEDDPQFLDIGTCGLHVVNGAFKTGMEKTGWNLLGFFRALYYLFKDSPARRGIYVSLTKTHQMPLKFCSIRWLGNIEVVKRALEMLPSLKTYVQNVSGTNQEPSSNSFKTIVKNMKDPLILAKLAFFQSLAEEFEPFLLEFQTNAPMVPFLYNSLNQLLTAIMGKFVKDEVLRSTELTKIDVFEKSDGLFKNLKSVKEIDLGYATRAALRKCSGVSVKEVLYFRKECRSCLQHVTKKLMEKSPLAYSLTKDLSFLNPNQIALSKETSILNMTSTLDNLTNSNWLPASTVEKADREFKILVSSEVVMTKMAQYSRSENRLDNFWYELLAEKMENLLIVVKMLLPMSHGNAALERGFSINKELLVENLRNESLIAQRMVHDSVTDAGGLEVFKISKELVLFSRNSNSRWKIALEERKKNLTEKEKISSAKRKATIIAKELEEKKKRMLDEMQQNLAAIDKEIKQAKDVATL